MLDILKEIKITGNISSAIRKYEQRTKKESLWIHIKEKEPNEGEIVIVYGEDGFIEMAKWDEGDFVVKHAYISKAQYWIRPNSLGNPYAQI